MNLWQLARCFTVVLAAHVRLIYLCLSRYSDTVHSDYMAERVCEFVWASDVGVCVGHSVGHLAVSGIR